MLKHQPKNRPTITEDWLGETVVCIGGGPSLTQEDVMSVQGKARVIAVNDAYRLAPWADILYACDLKWWQWASGAEYFLGERWTQDKAAASKYKLNLIHGEPGAGLSQDPSKIHHGSNSGYQAINFAYLKGCSRVILLGYDMQMTDNKAHWFGDHPDKIRSSYPRFVEQFKSIADQNLIEIINCSRQTSLHCFPKLPLEDILWIT